MDGITRKLVCRELLRIEAKTTFVNEISKKTLVLDFIFSKLDFYYS